MAKTDRIQVRIDHETKTKADELFAGLGLTTSSAVTMFIQQALISGGIPFNVDHTRKCDNLMDSHK